MDNVIFAIGDTVDANLGLAVNKWGEFVKNEVQYVNDHNANLYEVADPETNQVVKGSFVVGWSRKASDGLVGLAKKDGETGVSYVLEYLRHVDSSTESVEQRLEKLKNTFAKNKIEYVEKSDLEILEKVESEEATKRALEFYKFNHNSDMMNVINSRRPVKTV